MPHLVAGRGGVRIKIEKKKHLWVIPPAEKVKGIKEGPLF